MSNFDWLFPEKVPPLKEEPIWVTADKRKIPLSKMTTQHICNCLRLMNSVLKSRKSKWQFIFLEELTKRKTNNFFKF